MTIIGLHGHLGSLCARLRALLVHYVCDGWRNDCGRGRGKEHSRRKAKYIFVQLTLNSNAWLLG